MTFKDRLKLSLQMYHTHGEATYEMDLQYRRKGQSTAIIFKTIADAMSNPGTPIWIRDHFRSYQADKLLYRRTQEVIHGMSLTANFEQVGDAFYITIPEVGPLPLQELRRYL